MTYILSKHGQGGMILYTMGKWLTMGWCGTQEDMIFIIYSQSVTLTNMTKLKSKWISDHICYKEWDGIASPILKLDWFSHWIFGMDALFTPQFTGHVIAYPCWLGLNKGQVDWFTSYKWRSSYCGDKIILYPSYLHNGIVNIDTELGACPQIFPDSKVHGANMGPTWVLSAPDMSHNPGLVY